MKKAFKIFFLMLLFLQFISYQRINYKKVRGMVVKKRICHFDSDRFVLLNPILLAENGGRGSLNRHQKNKHKVQREVKLPQQHKSLQDVTKLEKYSKLKKGRNEVKMWFKRNDYLGIIICTQKLGHFDFLLMGEPSVSVKWLITERCTFNCWRCVELEGIERIEDVDVILMTNPHNVVVVMGMFKTSVKIVNMDTDWRLIEQLHGLEWRGIQTLVLEMPGIKKVANPSKWEKVVVRPGVHGWELLKTNFGKYFSLSGLNEKYKSRKLFIGESLKDNGQIRLKRYSVRMNKKGKYVNVVNHVRPAVGIPHEVIQKIHIVGDSTAHGVFVMDEDTLASALQQYIKKGQIGKEVLFASLAYASYGASFEEIQLRLRDIIIGERDVVVIVVNGGYNELLSEFQISCEENGIPFYDAQPHYNRPHNLGEVFLDRVHLNPKGNREAGRILYDRMFVNSVKLSRLDIFKHRFGGDVNSMPLASMYTATVVNEEVRSEFDVNPDMLSFIENLKKLHSSNEATLTGAVVVNCNPFTLGHLYLVETAVGCVDRLYVFVVEENKSEIPFAYRVQLVETGTAHVQNVLVLPSGKFIISGMTLPEYFVKGNNPNIQVDASMDLDIFCRWIRPAIGVHVRFVGDEPLDMVTLQYNNAMKEVLPTCGVSLLVIPRKENGGAPISASYVRALSKKRKLIDISKLVPEATFVHLWKYSL